MLKPWGEEERRDWSGSPSRRREGSRYRLGNLSRAKEWRMVPFAVGYEKGGKKRKVLNKTMPERAKRPGLPQKLLGGRGQEEIPKDIGAVN